MVPSIVIHGGAGRIGDLSRLPLIEEGARAAVTAGLDVLAAGGSALDAVQAAVRVLEDCPEFNSGIGAVLTRDGDVELDAAIMEGTTLRVGAVAAVVNLRKPVDLARLVMEDDEHVLLAGDGAWRFAKERGITPADPSVFITDRNRQRLETERARRETGEKPATSADLSGGTVGACAIDGRGHVAAATSTGGMNFKRHGRVGDTPIAGAGTFADDTGGAASATGHGERIARVGSTRTAVEAMRRGATAPEAARLAVRELGTRVGGEGGVICVDTHGRIGAAHNSEHMTHGWGSLADRVAHVAIASATER